MFSLSTLRGGLETEEGPPAQQGEGGIDRACQMVRR